MRLRVRGDPSTSPGLSILSFEAAGQLLQTEARPGGFDDPANAARGAATIGHAGQDPRARSALAQPVALYGGRRRHRPVDGEEPVADRDHGVVELVAFVPDRKELPAMA